MNTYGKLYDLVCLENFTYFAYEWKKDKIYGVYRVINSTWEKVENIIGKRLKI